MMTRGIAPGKPRAKQRNNKIVMMVSPLELKNLTNRRDHTLSVADTAGYIRNHNSLVPRTFLPPVFDCLHAKTEGEGLGDLSHARGQERGPIVVTHKICIYQCRSYKTTSCIDAVFWTLQSQVLGQHITRRNSRFFISHHPHLSTYITLHITMHMTKPPILHLVKLDGGNKAKTTTHHISMWTLYPNKLTCFSSSRVYHFIWNSSKQQHDYRYVCTFPSYTVYRGSDMHSIIHKSWNRSKKTCWYNKLKWATGGQKHRFQFQKCNISLLVACRTLPLRCPLLHVC